jgi:hypothetical protein
MPKPILVTIEHSPKKSFATAADWPGWSRSAKTEDEAIEALRRYASRYAAVVADVGEEVPIDDIVFEVVERLPGSAGTEFGVPSKPTEHDTRPLDKAGADRLARIVESAWAALERTASGAPEELRKGPRGGGRDTSKIVAHVVDADRGYADVIGIKKPGLDPSDESAVKEMRAEVLDVLRGARSGAPLAGRRWPARYAAHRIAWHALDHAWEIEDRSSPAPED